jgi:glycosyltransferase involved in cell wall biosynthesis
LTDNRKLQIISWQSVLTEHQIHLWTSLNNAHGVEVRIISARKALNERTQQGWNPPSTYYIPNLLLSNSDWLREGIREISDAPDALHLFGGLWADRRLFVLLLIALIRGRRIGLMSEPYSEISEGYLTDHSAVKGSMLRYVRPLLYRLAGLLIGKKIAPIFAISPKAVNQFTTAGFERENIYPFGYFIPKATNAKTVLQKSNCLKFAFVGALISRKGLDILLKAVLFCRHKSIDFKLDIFGHGDISKYSIEADSGVTFMGAIPFGQTQSVLQKYDLLIVPSRFDGWGVVVNEALLQGIPVIASSEVGAGAMVSKWEAGALFLSESVEQLAILLEDIVSRPEMLERWRENSHRVARVIAPEYAAEYLRICVESCLFGKPRIDCVWY